MPGTADYDASSTYTFSWFVVDSTLPLTLRLNDRRTGNAFIGFSGNKYTIKIGAINAPTVFLEGQFECGSWFPFFSGGDYNCRT